MLKSKRLRLLKSALLVLPCFLLSAQAIAERPRIGLVLGGGGARGFAHVGVLKVMEENRIPVDCVIGTSIGALVGGAYASGRSPAEMTERIENANWDELLSFSLPREKETIQQKQDSPFSLLFEVGISDKGQILAPTAVISTQKISFFLRELTYGGTISNFNDLGIPYRAIATNFETGGMVVEKDGDLVTAMRASMSVPGVFPAVISNGKTLVDGGLVRNLPVDIARETCADVVIAIDVGSPPLKISQITNIVAVADQYTRLMMLQNVRPQIESLKPKDVLITPVFGDLSSMDFTKGKDLIQIGRVAAEGDLAKLQQYSVSPEEYAEWQKKRKEARLEPKLVREVEIQGGKVVNPKVMEKLLDIKIDEPLQAVDFHENLLRVYSRGDHSQINYELDAKNKGDKVKISPIEKSWGPNYLSFGLSFATDFGNSNPWNITAQYRRTWLNDLGADWRTTLQVGSSALVQTEFYQPLSLDGSSFLSAYYHYNRGPLSIWNDGLDVAEYTYTKHSVGLDLGSIKSNNTELRVGPVFNSYRGDRSIGVAEFPNVSNRDYGIRVNAFYDTLDNYFFPRNGSRLNAFGYYAVDVNGDYDSYGIYGFDYRTAMPVGKDALQFKLRAQGAHKHIPYFADVTWLGGFMNLSSYNYQELIADEFIYGSIQYLYSMEFLSGSYLGLGLETGRVFNSLNSTVDDDIRYSGSVFLAYDSLLGPVYLGAAYGDNRKSRFYLMLGKPF